MIKTYKKVILIQTFTPTVLAIMMPEGVRARYRVGTTFNSCVTKRCSQRSMNVQISCLHMAARNMMTQVF